MTITKDCYEGCCRFDGNHESIGLDPLWCEQHLVFRFNWFMLDKLFLKASGCNFIFS